MYIKHSRQCFIQFSQKYSAARRIFNSFLFGYPDETLSLVFDTLHQKFFCNIVSILVCLFQVTLNNLEVSSNNIQKLKKDLEVRHEVLSCLLLLL